MTRPGSDPGSNAPEFDDLATVLLVSGVGQEYGEAVDKMTRAVIHLVQNCQRLMSAGYLGRKSLNRDLGSSSSSYDRYNWTQFTSGKPDCSLVNSLWFYLCP